MTGRRGNVQVLAVTTGAFTLAVQSWWPILPLVLRDRGASVFDVSLVWGSIALAAAAPQLIAGRLSDRYGRRPMVVWPSFSASIAYGLLALPSPWPWSAAILLLLSLSQGVQGQSFTVLLAESVPVMARAQAFAYFQFIVGLATVAGPVLGGLLLPHTGVAALMLATAAVGLGASFGRLFWLEETKPEAIRPFGWRTVFAGRLKRLLAASMLFQMALNLSLAGPFVALYLQSVRHLRAEAIAFLLGLGSLPGVLLSVPIGRHVQRQSGARATALAVAAFVLTLLAWLVLPSGPPIVLGYAVVSFCNQAATIAFNVLRSEVGEEVGMGAALGMVGFASGVVGALTLPLGGAVARLGAVAPFLMAVLFGAVAALVVLGLTPERMVFRPAQAPAREGGTSSLTDERR